MATSLPEFGLAVVLGAASFLAFWAANGAVKRRSFVLVTEANKCHELLATTTLEKRGPLNQRLVVAFGIENGFTSTNDEIHHKFRNGAKLALDRSNNDSVRKELIDLIKTFTENTLQQITATQSSISLVNLVRLAVFRTVLAIFFPETPRISDKDIIAITSTINTLWYHCKSPWKLFLATYFPHHSSIIQHRESLHQKLKEFFPSVSQSGPIKPSENPLNILLPAFIGLFRVVLHCFIEVRFRSSPKGRAEYKHLFRLFLGNPNARWYEEINDFSVQQIIAETLRLYPPTRRIYTQQANGVIAVDIEGLHRKGDIWGPKPMKWEPKRWKRMGLDVVQTGEYIPFGGKVGKPAVISRCPSRIRGGPKLIAVIVGALLEVLGEEWELLATGESGHNELGEGPLGSGRDAYEALMLGRVVDGCSEA